MSREYVITERGRVVIAIITLVAVLGTLVILSLLIPIGDDLRCQRLMADPEASEFTRDYYCD